MAPYTDPGVIVGLVALVVLLITVYKSVRIVNEGEMVALFSFGEMDAVLYPGLNFVPPFVSKTYPIDTEAMEIETGDGTVSVPQEFRKEIRKSDVGD